MTGSDARRTALDILARERASGFSGPDPYDALSSRLLAPLVRRSRLFRLALTQAVKRCPFDPRRLLGISPGRNPKALSLFLSGLSDMPGDDPASAALLESLLLASASRPDGSPVARPGSEGRPEAFTDGIEAGWGYDFPWQGRAFFQPSGFPTVVCTSFVIDALSDARSESYGAALGCAVRFVQNSLERQECDEGICFSYSPRDGSRVYNASLFAAKLLSRGHAAGLPGGLDERASRAADYVASRQSPDGSWAYGEAPHWHWVDGLHTGFVLETLIFLGGSLGSERWDGAIERGLRFYASELFGPDGTALYHPGRRYPVDPHTYAQGILTWLAAGRAGFDVEVDPAAIADRAVELLWDGRRKGFLLRRNRLDASRTIHTRWAQAWMFRALAALSRAEAG
ncbi:MAG: hypothetical protein QUS11_03550 [Candidatus Fermentibacter sp.]|nr:hypothetical protein [Candidatus Fermentibacter sp.]